MAWLLQWNSASSAPSYKREFFPSMDPVLEARLTLGRALTPQEVADIPRTIHVEPHNGIMPSIINFSGKLLVLSDRIINRLADLGDDHISTVPIDVKVKTPSGHHKYHLIYPPPYVDCFIDSETHFPLGNIHSGNGARCSMLRSRINGHHLWLAGERGIDKFWEWFISDEFARILLKEASSEFNLRLHCMER